MKASRMFRSVYPKPSLFIAIAVALFLSAGRPLAAQTPASEAATPAASSNTQTAAPAQPAPKDAVKPTPKQAREAQIEADTEKLFQLAQELKVEVDKSSKDTMSLSVIKKSEEIEKLARALKQEMRAN